MIRKTRAGSSQGPRGKKVPEDGTGTQTGMRTHQEWSADQLVCIRGCGDLEIELSTISESVSCVRKKSRLN